MRSTNELRRHPTYTELQLSPSPAQLASIERSGALAFKDPLLVTRQGIILDGHARMECAKRLGISMLWCAELDISEEEGLLVLLNKHGRSAGWNDYNRIRMASQLNTGVRRLARANQQAGGQFKGTARLTEANVRKETARAAGVGEGTVAKVDQLRDADPEVSRALASGEIPIHRAWLWRRLTRPQQREQLRQYRLRKLKRMVCNLVRKHRARTEAELKSLTLADLRQLLQGLSTLRLNDSADSSLIPVVQIDVPGAAVFLTAELYREVFAK